MEIFILENIQKFYSKEISNYKDYEISKAQFDRNISFLHNTKENLPDINYENVLNGCGEIVEAVEVINEVITDKNEYSYNKTKLITLEEKQHLIDMLYYIDPNGEELQTVINL